MSNQSGLRGFQLRHALVLLAGIGGAIVGFGCSTSSGDGGGGGGGGGGGTCAPDSSVTGCAASDGYSCAAGDSAPDVQNTNLTCSTPVSDGTSDNYCCYDSSAFTAPANTCAPDGTLTCPDPASFGYSCASGDNPMTYDSTLTCSDDAAATGDFCCYTEAPGGGGGGGGGGGSTCAPDTSVMGCEGSDGYSCATGDAAPDVADTTLICSTPTTDSSGNDLYCCFTSPTFASGTCAYDSSLDSSCPDPASFGFTCQGTDTPDQTDSSLTCSADQGTGQFCCYTENP